MWLLVPNLLRIQMAQNRLLPFKNFFNGSLWILQMIELGRHIAKLYKGKGNFHFSVIGMYFEKATNFCQKDINVNPHS